MSKEEKQLAKLFKDADKFFASLAEADTIEPSSPIISVWGRWTYDDKYEAHLSPNIHVNGVDWLKRIHNIFNAEDPIRKFDFDNGFDKLAFHVGDTEYFALIEKGEING